MTVQPRKKNANSVCSACGVTVDAPDPLGITCDQNHYLCPDCFDTYFDTCLKRENWFTHVPVKCPLCKTAYYPNKVDAIIKPDKAKVYALAVITTTVAKNADEDLWNCPFCPFVCVFKKTDLPILAECKGDTCGKMSCTVCHLVSDDEKSFERHITLCASYGPLLKEVSDIVSQGYVGKCPGCGGSGMKDDNCTHMNCPRCQSTWCYMCGLASKECDVEKGTVWPIGHSVDWKTNSKRCPIYLQELHAVDGTWPETSAGALETFHRDKVLRLLKKCIDKNGRAKIAEMLRVFPVALNGFNLDECVKFKERKFFSNRIK